ncbi:transcriptional regulator [gamma proteobacterium HTCC5015]|nr:transcriptional regulator [gamma proteobacterium HTCC5015]
MDTLSLLLNDIRLSGARFKRAELQPPWKMHLHTPGVASFHVVTQGQCILVRGQEAPLEVHTGDVVILPRGPAHDLADSAGSLQAASAIDLKQHLDSEQSGGVQTLYNISHPQSADHMVSGYFEFDSDLARPLFSALPDLIHYRAMDSETPDWLHFGMMFLNTEIAAQRSAQQAIINRIADILLIECLRDYVDNLPEGSGNWLLALKDPALSAALSAMHSQPDKQWSVPQLADIACLSRSSFANRFGKVLGEPPLSYLTAHRMRLAAWQLRNSNQPICHIAEQVGYQSDAAFSQAFRRIHDCSPSRYREHSRLTS